MKRFFIFAMILTILLGISGMWAATLTVGPDGDYDSLQDAIDDVQTQAGDVIVIDATTLQVSTHIIVNKPVTIKGTVQNDNRTIIEGINSNNITVFEIASNDVIIEDLTITHSAMPVFGVIPWNEQTWSLVRIPQNPSVAFTGVIIRNNTIYVPAQTGAMSTWGGVGLAIGRISVNGLLVTGNEIYNTRNGIAAHYNNVLEISGNNIYNTKGGVMNYAHDPSEANNRTITNNTWGGQIHNEWDIVWNSGGNVGENLNYVETVLDVSNANNEAYVCDLRTTITPTANIAGNRSHIFVVENGTTTKHQANGNKNNPYATFELANDAVVPGGKVLVINGQFNGNIEINKPMIMRGIQSRDGLPVINGTGVGSVVTIAADNVLLEGFQIQNSGTQALDAGILMQGRTGCQIKGNTILDNANGIAVAMGNGNTIESNVIHNNSKYGIGLVATSGNTIVGNSIFENTLDAIALDNAQMLGGDINLGATGNTIKNNTIKSLRDGIFLGKHCGNQIIQGNQVSDVSSIGIHMWKADTNTVSENTVSECATGIRVRGASNNEITENTFTQNGIGIKVEPADASDQHAPSLGNIIQKNKIYGNTQGAWALHIAQAGIGSVDMYKNWWGEVSGPYHATTNINGSGNEVTDNVLYDPWYDSAAMDHLMSNMPVENITQNTYYNTIQAAVAAAVDGDEILVSDGTYTGNVTVNKNISLKSVNGAEHTIIDGLHSGPQQGTVELASGRDGVIIGAIGHGFTVKGIDGPPNVEKAAIYLVGTHTNIIIEGNIIEARGDAALMGQYNASNSYVTINANTITGQTFNGDHPGGVGFGAQNTLLNVPRQLVVFGGGASTSNAHHFTFTNNILSGTCGGMSITDNNGNPIAPTAQGNTLASLEFAGEGNVISGNTFSGATTRFAEALRMRGPGDYEITGNTFSGSYPVIMTAQTTDLSIGLNRIQNALSANSFEKYVVVNSGRAIAVPSIFPTIQAGVAAAVAGNVVEASAGTFLEDVAIDKAITLRGQGNGTIVMGAKGGSTETIFIATSNATVENLAITRDGNNAADWDNANGVLNLTGIQVAQNQTGNIVQNCYLYGNRNAVYLNNARGNTFQNNLIDNNRTGVQLVNNVSNTLIKNNTITNNWTHGFVIYNNAITSTVTGLKVENNNISGNWYSQVECKTVLNPDPYPADTYDFVSNWFGSDTITASSNPAGEPGYSAQIPVEFGGTATPPLGGNDGLICGDLYHKVIYIPWYMDEEMTHKSNETVNNTTKQMWYTSIQAAIDAADPGDEIKVSAGEYNEAVVINKAITLKSVDGPEDTIINRPDGSLTTAVSITGTNLGTVTIDGFTVKGWTESGIVQSMSSGPGTTVHVLNNIVDSGGLFCRNGIQVTGDNSTVIGNTVLGASYGSDDYYGSGILVVNGSNITVSDNNTIGSDYGISVLCYNPSLSPMTDILIEGNECDQHQIGISVEGWPNSGPFSIGFKIIGNTLKNNAEQAIESIYTAFEDGFEISGNNFVNNPIHLANWSDTTLSPAQIYAILTGNIFDHTYVRDQIIYGYGTGLYVHVPDNIIPDGFEQIYSVVATQIADVRGFNVTVSIPKADFDDEPTDFAIGPKFSEVSNTSLMYVRKHTNDDWVFEVSGLYLGGFPGITETNLVLFSFKATSTLPYSNVPEGCYITIDEEHVVLKDDQNPYHSIPCFNTHDGWVLIDNTAPTVVIHNLYSDHYNDPVPYIIQHDGDGMIIPEFDLKYTDDYSLDTAMYLIVPQGGAAPTMPGDFSNEVGPVAGIETLINDWALPINTLADGTYTIYFLVVDEAGNYSIISWDFVIDNTPPAAIVWDELIPCRTTADANESIDLKWENIGAVVKNHIWVLSYGDAGTNYTHYPEYADHSEPTIEAPNPYGVSPQDGWVKFTIDPPDPLEFPYELTGLPRGYYYVTIFASDSAGNMSAVPEDPFYRESLNYWPGDVLEAYGAVNVTDMDALSWAWGTVTGGTGWNPQCDVGPSTDYARRSRPMPDGKIDFDDMMMFAMNYENTDYEWYPRNEAETDPVSIALAYQDLGGMLQVNLYLDGNNGFVTGLDIPVAFGSGLSLQNVEIGDVWPESSLLLHTNENGVVTVSCAAFGAGAVIEGNGLVASLSFAVNGHDNSMQLQRMTARGWDNSEIEIVGNPTGEVANEDLVNVIPDSSYLGSVHPNPFRGSATLQYGLKEAGSVKLGIYNTRGQLVRNLMNEGKAAGTYQITWDGSDENGLRVSSGIYLFRMETADVIKTQKAMLLK